MKFAASALILVALAGCEDPVQLIPVSKHETNSLGRIQVTRIAVFEDRMAYGGYRGIYIIRDIELEKEYLGISGIGISETGTHGKGHSDER